MEKEVRTKFTTLYLDPVVSKRLNYYTQAAKGEVSGLGTVIKDEKGRYVVNKIYLLEQESTGADTELNPEAISKLMLDMMNAKQDPGLLKFWWHSHADMGVFWSGTDDTCAETLSKEHAFSLVVNKKGEKRCRLDLYNPFRVTFDGVRVEEIIPEDKVLQEECEKEVKEKVKSPGQKWKGWSPDDDKGYSEYGYGDYYGKHRYGSSVAKQYHLTGPEKKNRVSVSDTLLNDIERLLDFANSNKSIFNKETWTEYIKDTVKEIAKKRFEKRAACANFGTFTEKYADCKGKCKVKKECAYWTKVFDETENDAKELLTELNSDVPPGCFEY